MIKIILTSFLSVLACFAQRHIIRLTENMVQQIFDEDIGLGEVVAEQVVNSQEACGQLCQANPACRSVMLMGQLCRMFRQPISPVRISIKPL